MIANDMGNYILQMFPGGESYLCVDQGIKLEGDPLFLTGKYLHDLKQNGFEFDLKQWFSIEEKEGEKVFVRLSIDDIEKWMKTFEPEFLADQVVIIIESLKAFYEKVSGRATIIDQPIFIKQLLVKEFEKGNKLDDAFMRTITWQSLLFETLAIIQVFNTWFNPNYLLNRKKCFNENGLQSSISEVQNAESDIRTHTLTAICFNVRCRDLRSEPFWDIDTGKMCIQYDSTGALPLCWAEIWQGLQRNLLAGICPHCGKIYEYPRNNYRKDNCGSKECKKEALIARHGGVDGYKTWERERRYWK